MSFDVKEFIEYLKNPWFIGITLILFILNFSSIERFIFYDDVDHENRKYLLDNELTLIQNCSRLNSRYTRDNKRYVSHGVGHRTPNGFFSYRIPVFGMTFQNNNKTAFSYCKVEKFSKREDWYEFYVTDEYGYKDEFCSDFVNDYNPEFPSCRIY